MLIRSGTFKFILMRPTRISRRNFIHKSALTAGMVSVVPFGLDHNMASTNPSEDKSPREVWIAGVSQMGLKAKTPELMVEKILEILKETVTYKPDIVCLPEAGFSQQNHCYTICPVYNSAGGKIYNSAVVFDRNGKHIGQYDKIHETVEEIADGVSCGALFQTVIKTEFGYCW